MNINTYIEDDIKAIIKLIQDKIRILETYIVDGYHLSALFNKLYTLYSQDIINNDIANLAFKDQFLNEYNQMKSYDALVNNRIYYYLNHFLIYNKKYQDLITDNNSALFNKFYINELTHNNFSNNATTTYGRWCSLCGSRKLDIYDCIKNYTNTNYFGNNMNNNHLLIKNLYCELIDDILYITWQDVNIETYKYTLLFINNELIGQYKYNEHINKPVEIYTNKFSNINIYKICVINYDIFDEQIAQSLNQYIINNNYYDHSNIRINDLQIHQETILLPQEYFIKNTSDFYKNEIIINTNNDIHTNNINIIDKENIYIDNYKNTSKKEVVNTQAGITDITVSLDNLSDYYILDIFCFVENNILYIKWRDITTCKQSKLFLNSVLVGVYEYNEHVEIPAAIDLNQLTQANAYTIYIANYNDNGKEIAYKKVKYNRKTQILNNNTDINIQVYVIDEDKNRYALPRGLTQFNNEQLSTINQPTAINTQIIYTHIKPKSEIGMNKSKYELDLITNNNKFYDSINNSLMQNILYQNDNIDLNLYKTKLEDNIINRQFNEYDFIYKPSFLHKNTSNWARKNVLVIEYTARSKKNILKRSLRTFPRDIDFDFTCLPINVNNQLFQIINDLDISTWYFKIFPVSNYIQARLIDSNFTEYVDNNYYIWQNINMTSSKLAYQLYPLTFECIQLQCKNLSKRVELTWIDPYVNWKKTLIYIKEYDGKLVSHKLI